ncbi:MAG: hypothetical protein JST65_12235 [Acidobacteria bacterium]|nr:hypothetical protein [Acidobacteriota bacterium]
MAINAVSATFLLPCGCALQHTITFAKSRPGQRQHASFKLQLLAAAEVIDERFKQMAAEHVCKRKTTRG